MRGGVEGWGGGVRGERWGVRGEFNRRGSRLSYTLIDSHIC